MWREGMRGCALVLLTALCLFAAVGTATEPKLICQQKWKELEYEGMKIRLYRLRADAFPHGQHYKLFVRTVDGVKTPVFRYVANPKGHLIVNEPEEVLRSAPYIVTPLRRGEMVGYGMLSSNGEEEIYTEMVPFPNQAIKGKRKVSVALAGVDGMSFICSGSGFAPGETASVVYAFGDARLKESVLINQRGAFDLAFQFPLGHGEGGEAVLEVEGAQGSVSVSFPWGEKACEIVGASCLEIK